MFNLPSVWRIFCSFFKLLPGAHYDPSQQSVWYVVLLPSSPITTSCTEQIPQDPMAWSVTEKL